MEETKTYTQEEVDKLLQAEADKRVTEALKKQQRKFEEAQKLATMDANEKFEYELQQREKAIAEKEKALQLAEMKNEATKILSEKGLSIQLVDLVLSEDAESVKDRITILEKAFKDNVSQEVTKRIGSNIPEQSKSTSGILTREQFNKMSLREQAQLFEQNPELYNSITKG